MCNVRKNVAIELLLVSDAFQRKYILFEFCEQGVTAIKFCKWSSPPTARVTSTSWASL